MWWMADNDAPTMDEDAMEPVDNGVAENWWTITDPAPANNDFQNAPPSGQNNFEDLFMYEEGEPETISNQKPVQQNWM